MSALEDEEITESIDEYALFDIAERLPEAWDDLGHTEQRYLFEWAMDVAGYYPEHDSMDVLWRFDKFAYVIADILDSARAHVFDPSRYVNVPE